METRLDLWMIFFCGGFIAMRRVAIFGFRAALIFARGFLATLACRVAAPEDGRTPGAGFFADLVTGTVVFLRLAAGRDLIFGAETFLALAFFALVRARGEASLRAGMAFLLFVPGVARFMRNVG